MPLHDTKNTARLGDVYMRSVHLQRYASGKEKGWRKMEMEEESVQRSKLVDRSRDRASSFHRCACCWMVSGKGVDADIPAQSVTDAGTGRSRQLERCTTCCVARCNVDD